LSKNQRRLPQPLRFRQRRSGNLPRSVQLVNNFFFEPRSFFSERAARISPRRRSGNLSRPPLAVNRFLLLFSKNFFAPPCPASRPCPAQRDIPSRSGENGLCTSTTPLSTSFYFFSDFFLHPR